jgi:hypothetical protein
MALFPSIGVIFKHIELWKDLSLLLNLAQNFLNIAAFYKSPSDTEFCLAPNDCFIVESYTDKRIYFNMSQADFDSMINILGLIQVALASLIVIEFFFRKIPPLFKQIKEELEPVGQSGKRKFLFIKEFLAGTVFNSQVLYYVGYLVFAILGYTMNQFFFAFLLLEVFSRFKTLRNVIMSISGPIKELSLTFILWIILIYYFSLLAYNFFRDSFTNPLVCETLFRCLVTIFYENNKVIFLNLRTMMVYIHTSHR